VRPGALNAVGVVATIIVLASGSACDRGDTAATRMSVRPGASAGDDGAPPVRYERSFTVDENDEVVNVAPTLVADPRGGLLVVDVGESQLRRYSDEGKLLWHAGRRGQGPGEFITATVVGRLPSGQVVAGERSGRLTFFDSTGQALVRTVETRLDQVEEMVVVNDSILLLSGVGPAGVAGPRLHLWSTTRDTLLHSFFTPFSRQRNPAVARLAGYTEAAVRGDTIAAVFGASDTVYLFTMAGRAAGQFPIPTRSFRPAPLDPPRRTITNPAERAKWISTFDVMADVEWLPDGTLLLAYQSIDGDRAMTRRWHLLGATRDGRRTFEHRDFSMLLGTDPRTGLVYLVDRGAEAPNRWNVARVPPS
jgi:hypothetical protein